MLQKNDFIEIDFTGRVKDGEIFDTNIKEEASKIGIDITTRPLVICLGQGMILPSIDDFLLEKELGSYSLELEPEKAFGIRNQNLVKIVPVRVFLEKNLVPQRGMVFDFDNMLGKVTAVSGGRVIVDFNNPLANRTVVYELNVKRKIEDGKEKINCLQDFFFRKRFEFEIKEKSIVFKVEEKFRQFLEIFSSKFNEILGMNLEFELVNIVEK